EVVDGAGASAVTTRLFSTRKPPTPGSPAYGSRFITIPGRSSTGCAADCALKYGGSQGDTPAPWPRLLPSTASPAAWKTSTFVLPGFAAPQASKSASYAFWCSSIWRSVGDTSPQ